MKTVVSIFAWIPIALFAQGPKPLEQIPNLKQLPDVTAELQKQIEENSGDLVLRGAEFFRITKPLEFDLKKLGA
ncbi:MAG: hypothetical protein AAF585_19735, partial [Verrucomicrobiota bacterium]